MKHIVIFLNTTFLFISLAAMDNTPIELPHSSVEVILANTALWFHITPDSIVSRSSEVGFRKKDPAACKHGCPIEIFVTRDTQDINGIPIAKGSAFCRQPGTDNCLWTSSNLTTTFHFPTKYKIYYGEKDWQMCSCAFSLVMTPNDDENKDYKIELCADGLHIAHKAPFNLKGLEHDYFKNFTFLAVRNCQKLQGTGGALNNILEVLKHLKYLDLSRSHLDETEIDAEHHTLEVLKMRSSSCTAIKRLIMPKLLLCRFDYSALNTINRDAITIDNGCVISAIGCKLLTMHGEKNISVRYQ